MEIKLTLENIEHENGSAVSVRKGTNAWHVMTCAPLMLGTYLVRSLCGRTVGNSNDVEMTATPTGEKFCKSCIRVHRALLDAVSEEREDSAPIPTGMLFTFRYEGEPVTGPSESERAELVKRERERRESRSCPGTGLPPVPGSRVQRDDSSVSVPDTFVGKHSGKCPETACGRIIAVSREGGMRRHNRAETREIPAPEAREDSGKIWGLTFGEIRAVNAAYYAVHPISPEIAALPDPTVKRVWSGTDSADGASVVPCDYKGDVEIIDPEKINGKCPECRAYIPLQDVESDPEANRIGKHNRYGVANPPRPKILLSSESLDTVEHGSIPGSPADADKRRGSESKCKRSGKVASRSQGGKKECSGRTGCGRSVELVKVMRKKDGELVAVWLYPDHYLPITKSGTVDSFRRAGADGKGERKVTPSGSGADAGKGQRDHGSIDGSANTGRQNMPPVRPGGWVGKAGTMSLPAMVRPGVDPEVSGTPCPVCEELPEIAHKGKSKSWRRNHSRRLRAYWDARNAARKAQREADIAAGRIIPATVRRELRKAASIGSFAEGTVAGVVAHGGKRPEVAPKVKPRGMTRTGK